MSGSLSGHGEAWPLPTVTNAALHAALHRAALGGVHKHVPGRSSSVRDYSDENRESNGRAFGSLTTAGPFPVLPCGTWLFPRPLDSGNPGSATITFLPLAGNLEKNESIDWKNISSLPTPLKYSVANTKTPSKEKPAAWWSPDVWEAYLSGKALQPGDSDFCSDSTFSDTEFSYGIGIDPDTGAQDGVSFYSAHYLRLREGCRLGLLAEAIDKKFVDPETGHNDIVCSVFPNSGAETSILTGGQQRVCTVERSSTAIPLPAGKSSGFPPFSRDPEKFLLKWILLSPAIFPEIDKDEKKGISSHPGGWLPSWIRENDGQVMLKSGNTERGECERRNVWRDRVKTLPEVPAQLVAALIDKPVPVTGYALGQSDDADRKPGPKSTHLAVPAGSVYYFECVGQAAAEALAAALNWHGNGDLTTIRNRRSTLMGEKGFGLGVCAPWQYHSGIRPA